jgi:hypothetical protein
VETASSTARADLDVFALHILISFSLCGSIAGSRPNGRDSVGADQRTACYANTPAP